MGETLPGLLTTFGGSQEIFVFLLRALQPPAAMHAAKKT